MNIKCYFLEIFNMHVAVLRMPIFLMPVLTVNRRLGGEVLWQCRHTIIPAYGARTANKRRELSRASDDIISRMLSKYLEISSTALDISAAV